MKNDDGSYAVNRDGPYTHSKIIFTWTKEKRDKAIAAQLLLKRLTAYTVFTSFAFTVLLFPFYQGEGYGKIVKDAAEAALPGMRIWVPEVRFSLISWPSDLPVPDQVVLGVSLSVLALEYLPVAWGLAMQRRYPHGIFIANEKDLQLPLLGDVESGVVEETRENTAGEHPGAPV